VHVDVVVLASPLLVSGDAFRIDYT